MPENNDIAQIKQMVKELKDKCQGLERQIEIACEKMPSSTGHEFHVRTLTLSKFLGWTAVVLSLILGFVLYSISKQATWEPVSYYLVVNILRPLCVTQVLFGVILALARLINRH